MIGALKVLRSFRDRPGRPDRRRSRPAVEPMEARTLLAFDFTSAFAFGGAGIIAQKAAVNSAGNIYVTGTFAGKVDFDPAGGTGGLLTAPSGTSAIFVAEYSPAGNLDWVTPFYATGSSAYLNTGTSVAFYGGDVFATGEFTGTVNFSTTGVTNYVTAPGTDVFVVELNAKQNGALLNQNTFGPPAGQTATDDGLSVSVDIPDNEVVLTGFFTGTLVFPGSRGSAATLVENNRTGSGTDTFYNAFAVDLDANLNYTNPTSWAYDLASGASAMGTSVAIDPANGYVYVVGTFSGTGAFNPTTGGQQITSDGKQSGDEQEFVEEYTPAGIFERSGAFGSVPTYPLQDFFETPTIAVDDSGNAYITGLFEGSGIDFNPGTGDSRYLDSSGNGTTENAFLIQVNSSLDFQWYAQISGSSPFDTSANTSNNSLPITSDLADLTSGVAVNDAGNVYIGGVITSAANVSGSNMSSGAVISPFAVSSTDNAPTTVFAAQFTTDGEFVADQVGGGSNPDWRSAWRPTREGRSPSWEKPPAPPHSGASPRRTPGPSVTSSPNWPQHRPHRRRPRRPRPRRPRPRRPRPRRRRPRRPRPRRRRPRRRRRHPH